MSGPSLPAGLSLLYSQLSFHPAPVTASFTGQTVIITGANAGLGKETATIITRAGASKVIIACRSVAKGEDAKRDIEQSTGREGVLEVWQLDMASFASVRSFAERASALERLDVVVQNAGVWPTGFDKAEGHEATITVNVISPFLLTRLLSPVLERTATTVGTTPRVSIVSSTLHKFATLKARKSKAMFSELQQPFGEKEYDGRYQDSKLLVMLYGERLAASMPQSGNGPKICLNMVCPGWCISGLTPGRAGEKLLARPTEDGAKIIVDAVDAAKVSGRHGAFLSDCKVKKHAAWMSTQDGKQTGERVWTELNQILDAEMAKS